MRRFRYRLVDAVDRRELGWFMSSREDWKPGDVVGSADRPSRVVIAVVEPGHDIAFRAYLVVASVGQLSAVEAEAS
jgi:hypothetical protein